MKMMYHLKRIVYSDNIPLPNCMYYLKKINNFETLNPQDVDINVSNQVMKFLKTPNKKMVELEQRQDQLLKKLDVLYDRITTISNHCKINSTPKIVRGKKESVLELEEIVMVFSPDNLPWFLNIFLKKFNEAVNVSWHVHSSVPNEKLPKIKGFVKNLRNFPNNSKIHLRLIFKCVDTELKISSLGVPIVGNVNVLRYLHYAYPAAFHYDQEDYSEDQLLDLCHQLERTPDKDKEALFKKIFSQYNKWIYKNEFSIVDLAVYNVVKQSRNIPKCVPKEWFDSCEKLCT